MASTNIPKGQHATDLDCPSSLHEERRFNGITVNLTTRELFRGDIRLDVEPKVFKMLALLLRIPGRVVTYGEFKEAIWPDVQIELLENVNVLASKLRETLAEGNGTRCILNKRGEGYFFNPKVTVECSVTTVPDAPVVIPRAMPEASISRRRVLLPALAGSALLTAGGVYSFIHLAAGRSRPVDWRVNGNTLTVLGDGGRELWHHVFAGQLNISAYQRVSGLNLCVFTDLDGDGNLETIFICNPFDPTADRRKIICFGVTGKIRWEFFTNRKVVDAQSREWAPPYFVANFAIIPGSGPGSIVITNIHYWSFPNQVVVLDANGKLVGEFWHRGHLAHVAVATLQGNSAPQVLLGGVNDAPEYRQATLLVFDPQAVAGASCSPTGEPYFQGFPRGTQNAEVFFPRTRVGLEQEFNRVTAVMVTADRITVTIAEGINEQNENVVIYDLDFHLNAIRACLTDPLRSRYRELEVAGKIPKGTIDGENERLKKQVRIVRRSV